MNNSNSLSHALVTLGLLLVFVASVFLPAAHECGTSSPIMGYVLASLGFIGLQYWQPGWYANPLFLILLARLVLAARVSGWHVFWAAVMVALAATSLTISRLPGPYNETPLCGFAVGYWLWLGSMIGLTAVFAYRWLVDRHPA